MIRPAPPIPMATLKDKFRGCLLGSALGDIAGAVVEAESPGYIARTFRSIDEMLLTKSVEEFSGPDWQVGRFTDDTQMTLCVAEWLLADESHSPELLLARFAEAHEPWRRYGPGTEAILQLFGQHRAQWRELSTAAFPEGSLGNGSAMRVAPIGLAYFDKLKTAAAIAIESSRPTHSHSLAYQGAVLQCVAVAIATAASEFAPAAFLEASRARLTYFADLMQDTSKYTRALDAIAEGLARAHRAARCRPRWAPAWSHTKRCRWRFTVFSVIRSRMPTSFIKPSSSAATRTRSPAMAGAISGAFLGAQAIPPQWRRAVRETKYSPDVIEALADRLFAKFARER